MVEAGGNDSRFPTEHPIQLGLENSLRSVPAIEARIPRPRGVLGKSVDPAILAGRLALLVS
jgi:hypothetical protein